MDNKIKSVHFDIDSLYLEIEDLIVKSKMDLNIKINNTLISLYWKIGQIYM